PRLLKRDDDTTEQQKRADNAAGKSEPELENPLGVFACLLDETQHLDRDDRKHTRHEIENEAADEGHQEVSRQSERLLRVAGNFELLTQNIGGALRCRGRLAG